MADLGRFRDVQAAIHDAALAELRAGDKRGHWMWFVFPQIVGLGHSPTARRYAIADLSEARAYLADPVLGGRFAECVDAMLGWAGRRGTEAILGGIDAIKLRSSLTLFEAAGESPRCAAALDAFYAGERDDRTLALL